MKTQNDVETVLLVEETEDNRCMVRRLLEMSGYRVVEARNGEEAVRTAEAQKPKLILMDLSLPLIDGLAATRLIRKLPACSQTPIIAVSAHDSADFHPDALQPGSDPSLPNPIHFSH